MLCFNRKMLWPDCMNLLLHLWSGLVSICTMSKDRSYTLPFALSWILAFLVHFTLNLCFNLFDCQSYLFVPFICLLRQFICFETSSLSFVLDVFPILLFKLWPYVLLFQQVDMTHFLFKIYLYELYT